MQHKIISKLAISAMLTCASISCLSTILDSTTIVFAKKTSSSKSSDNSSDNNSKKSDSSSAVSDGAAGSDNPTEVPNNEYVQPNHYMDWLQWWGPWAKGFTNGGSGSSVGTGGKNWAAAPNNGGCVVTSMAIQGARGGLTERSKGQPFNPLWNHGSDYAVGSFSYGGKSMSVIGGTPAPSGGNLTEAQVLAECKKIASAGNYPLIRGNGNSHTVAYRGAGNDSLLVYDPARSSTGNWFKPPYNNVVALKVSGNGTHKFADAPSTAPNSSSGSSSSSSANSKNGGANSSNDGGATDPNSKVPAIKPIFNPFYTPQIRSIPADQDVNQDQTGAQIMQEADGFLPWLLSFMRIMIAGSAYLWAALTVISILIAYFDLLAGGLIQEKILASVSPMTKDWLFPNGKFMGVDGGVSSVTNGGNSPALGILWQGTKRFTVILVVLVIISTGSLSTFVAIIIEFFANLFNGWTF